MSTLNISPDSSISSQSTLEREYIKEYLQNQGYLLEDLRDLPAEHAKKLMTEACIYASLKLEQIASRAKFREAIRNA